VIKRRFRTYLKVFLPSVLVVVLAFLFLVGYSAYSILYPELPTTEGSPESYLLTYEEIRVPRVVGSTWYLPGAALNPSVYLCHDYSFNRLSALNLASALHDVGYHVYVVGFRGHLAKGGPPSSLGLVEGEDLARIVEFTAGARGFAEGDVGVWGVGLGGLAALRAAALNPHIKVLVVDSPYPSSYELVKYQLEEKTGLTNSVLLGSVGFVSAIYNGSSPSRLLDRLEPSQQKVSSTLYITGRDKPIFEAWAKTLFDATPGYKESISFPRSRRNVLTTPEWNGYDLKVVQFFQNRLPRPVEPEKTVRPKSRTRRR